jgi:hypothetical protein
LLGRGIKAAVAVAAVAAVSLIAAAPGHTWNEEATEGCTPGYWKNHTEAWVGFTPDQTLGSVFTFPNAADPLASATLLEALEFESGPTLEDKQAVFLHHAVAALLNASAGLDYQLGVNGVIKTVNRALARHRGGKYERLKNEFDEANNLGCPL